MTATNRALAPRLAASTSLVWLGRDAPDGVARLGWRGLLAMRFGATAPRIWHARRNNEMLVGLLLRGLGWPLRLVFTSAAQRHHSWVTRFLIARMDAVIATSAAAASYLRRPATVIHHGVDTELYAPPADRAAEFARHRPAWSLRHRLLRPCAPPEGNRRLRRFHVPAAAVLSRRDCGGDWRDDSRPAGFPRELLEAQVAEAGLSHRVRFLGELPIDEVPPWYRRISIYAFTSRQEGFGLTLLEAMAAGNALVAARAGAAEAVVAEGTGVLVPPGDVDALVAALEPLMRSPDEAAAMGERARAHVAAHFSLEVEAAAIVDVYRTVAGGAG